MNIALPFLSCLLIIHSGAAFSHESDSEVPSSEQQQVTEQQGSTEVIQVIGKRQEYLQKRRTDDDSTYKTEVLAGESLDRFGAQTLADAIPQASGVDTQVFCANCGAKRLTINGLRGEHTTILIDGFPLHSTVSSFYGIDAIPINGISEIQVKRGAGSSLIAPESIGGTLDLISINPVMNKFSLFTEGGSHGDYQSSVLATALAEKSRVLFAGQLGARNSWDLDKNNVGESPYRKTQSTSIKLIQDLNEANTVTLRYSHADLLIIGGNARRYKPHDYSREQASSTDFVDTDVRESYIGNLAKITDVIDLSRKELALQYDLYLSAETSLQLRTSFTKQNMDALYSHGYDYHNRDEISFYDLKYQAYFGDDHVLTLGIDTKLQRMRSTSEALFATRNPPLQPDSLNFVSQAFYIMDEWDVSDDLELALALRLDHLAVRWLHLDHKIENLVMAPRAQAKYQHTGHISSRFSYGLGYRPPLTLFESEHGSNHDGFIVEIREIEKAHSLVYGLDFNYPTWFAALSGHYTILQDMAYGEDRTGQGLPILYRNDEDTHSILVGDVFLGGKPTETIDLQLSYEKFIYEDGYTEKLPTAAIEDRTRLDVEYRYLPPATLNMQATYVGPRDLRRYGYDEHYNRYDTDVSSDTFGQVSEPKKTRVPGFWQLDASHRFAIAKNYALTMRVNNILDYTQTRDADDSPTTWHWHVNHAHYDNFHTWGPLTGRQYFVGLEAQW